MVVTFCGHDSISDSNKVQEWLNQVLEQFICEEEITFYLGGYAISKRNQWMLSEADVVIAYVTHGWGGAAKTLEYAIRKHKRIVQYSER